MSVADVDSYLAGVPEPGRSTLEALRVSILRVLPNAEQVISYGMPGFSVDGRVLAGFAANKKFLSYYPHSGQVIAMAGEATANYESTKGALHFALDSPLSDDLVELLIRLKQSLHA